MIDSATEKLKLAGSSPARFEAARDLLTFPGDPVVMEGLTYETASGLRGWHHERP